MIFKYDTHIKHLYVHFQRAGVCLDNPVDLLVGSCSCQYVGSDIVGFLGFAATILVSAHAEGFILIGSGSCVEEFSSALFPYSEHLLHYHGQP